MTTFDNDHPDMDKFVRHLVIGEACDMAFRDHCRRAGISPNAMPDGASPLLYVDAAMRRAPGTRTRH